MNDLPRQKLGEIVAKYGISIVENPRRCEGLLRDYCGGFRREISVLTMALEERVPLDLLAAKTTPRQVLFGRLTQRLCDNLALSEQAAHWSVHSWALALGIISDDEINVIEQQNIRQAQTTATVISSAAQITQQNKAQSSKVQTNQSQPANTTANKSFAQESVVVSANGSGDFASIGEAIGNVAPDTRLIIRPGIYNESVVVDKNVEIIGDGSAENIIIESANSSCVQMRADKAIVRNLTLRGSGARYGKAFFAVGISRGALVLEDCDISSDSLSCVAVQGVDANPTVKNCRIHDGADSGVYFFDNARGQIIECDIYRNQNVGVAITSGANPLIKNCRIFEGNNGGVVVWENGAAGEIENCEIFGHRLANVGVSASANPTFRSCKIFGGRDTGVFVHQGGYGKFEDCAVHDNQKAEVVVIEKSNSALRRCAIYNGTDSGIFVDNEARASIESCNIYDNSDAGVSINDESVVEVRRCNIHRNGTVAVRVKGNSATSVEGCDLRGNRIAAWESEHGVVIERKNNRE
jgi:hypothetical protein